MLAAVVVGAAEEEVSPIVVVGEHPEKAVTLAEEIVDVDVGDSARRDREVLVPIERRRAAGAERLVEIVLVESDPSSGGIVEDAVAVRCAVIVDAVELV